MNPERNTKRVPLDRFRTGVPQFWECVAFYWHRCVSYCVVFVQSGPPEPAVISEGGDRLICTIEL